MDGIRAFLRQLLCYAIVGIVLSYILVIACTYLGFGGSRSYPTVSYPDGWVQIESREAFGYAAEVHLKFATADDSDVVRHKRLAGWPLFCARQVTLFQMHDGYNAFPDIDNSVPLRPIPLGLAVDAATFGALAFALVTSVTWVMRRARARAGTCEACGYQLRGLARCPECGVSHIRPGAT